MQSKKLQINFFYALLLAVTGLVFFIFMPFLKVLFLAAVFAVVFYPVYKKLLSLFTFKGGDSLSSFVTVLIVLFVILIPFAGMSILIFNEVGNVYYYLVRGGGGSSLLLFLTQAGSYVNSIFPAGVVPPITVEGIQSYAGQAYGWIFTHFQALFSSAFKIVVGTFIMIFALFFFLRDGQKFKDVLISLSPLTDEDDRGILEKMRVAINSVIKGSLLVALSQGIMATIGFLIFGVPSAILWGTAAVFSAMIPSIGTSLVIMPAVLFLYFTKGLTPAIGLAIWGAIFVGLIDNILGPLILKRGIKIHPFFILLSVLGGLAFFGPIGFLAGPVILSLLFALVHIFPRVTDQANK
ncbi:MAG: AI-2E family transporter [Candidatus Taylorbacteria bacterium]